MAKLHRVKLNTETFSARSGQVLLDAALVAGVDIPHDCRAGRCGTCVTSVKAGITLGGETQQRGIVHACQARVFSDLSLAVEALPAVKRIDASITHIADLTDDVVELTLASSERLDLLAGQYCKFTFKGFPTRPFSPTAPLDGGVSNDKIRLNIKRVRDGRVSPNLGRTIKPGHRLTIDGPFGHAFLRPNLQNRLVLIGTGTGFAPVWAVCDAALKENPHREIVIVTGARTISSLYMWPALELARCFKTVSVIVAAEQAHPNYAHVRAGRPLDHLPTLTGDDIVYAAGSPVMVKAIGKLAQKANALFYSDPFEAAAADNEDWVTRAMSWLRTG
jgi:CDP-4-dehydro-6-deoxyglucose reductase, E3